jgi:WD40 repeat protein
VKIWDVATGNRLYTLSDAADGLTSVAYSPSSDRVAAVGYDKTIYIWNEPRRQMACCGTLQRHAQPL